MDCREVEEQDILERYVLDRLTDSERDAFERHYFGCDSCFSQVQTGLALQKELRDQPPAHVQEGRALFQRMWAWAPAFAVLMLVLAAGVWWDAARRGQYTIAQSSVPVANPHASPQTQQPSMPAQSLEELARVEAPPYSPVVLRGAEDEAQQNFDRGMQHYLKGDYAGAIPRLRASVKANPHIARFSFYLGACYLLTSQSDSGIESLRKVISLDDPSYSEAAHFYLAKAYLRSGNVSSAQQELQMIVKLGGSRAVEAEEILRQLGK